MHTCSSYLSLAMGVPKHSQCNHIELCQRFYFILNAITLFPETILHAIRLLAVLIYFTSFFVHCSSRRQFLERLWMQINGCYCSVCIHLFTNEVFLIFVFVETNARLYYSIVIFRIALLSFEFVSLLFMFALAFPSSYKSSTKTNEHHFSLLDGKT